MKRVDLNSSKLNLPKAIKSTITFHVSSRMRAEDYPSNISSSFQTKQMTWVCTNAINALEIIISIIILLFILYSIRNSQTKIIARNQFDKTQV